MTAARSKRKIVFVCTGNTCRSPMAQTILKKMLKEGGLSETFSVASCGIVPELSAPLNPEAAEALRGAGYRPPSHRAKGWSRAFEKSDALVLTMTRAQKRALPFSNVFSLGELTDGKDVPDPYGGTAEDYRTTLAQLEEQLGILYREVLAKS